MTKYEYDTMLVDKNNVDKFNEELKQRVEDGFEIFDTQMVAAGSGIHIGYFLRREIAGPITHQSVPMGLILELQELSNEVQHAEDGSGDGAQGDVDYERALVSFYWKTKEILGLR